MFNLPALAVDVAVGDPNVELNNPPGGFCCVGEPNTDCCCWPAVAPKGLPPNADVVVLCWGRAPNPATVDAAVFPNTFVFPELKVDPPPNEDPNGDPPPNGADPPNTWAVVVAGVPNSPVGAKIIIYATCSR